MLQQPIVIFCRIPGRITNLDIYEVIKIFHCIIGVVLNTAYQYLMYRLSSLFWETLLFLVFRWQETHKFPTEIEAQQPKGFSVSVSLVLSDEGEGEQTGCRLRRFSVPVLVSLPAHGALLLCLVISDLWSGSSEEVEDKVSATAGRKWPITTSCAWHGKVRWLRHM